MKPIPKETLRCRPEFDGDAKVRVSPHFTIGQATVLDQIADALTKEWVVEGRYVRATRSDALVELVERYRRNPPQVQEPDAG